jgi:hypothetical protein
MPNTQFDDVIYFSETVITVKGPLGGPEEDEHVRRAVVFAFLTQHPDGDRKKAVTVAGEALLYPLEKPTPEGSNWSLVCPANGSSMEPPPPDPSARELTHSYKYEFRDTPEWYFMADMEAGNRLGEGPAFGTAILLTFMQDGSIETYAWSGWVNVVESSVSADDPALAAMASSA